MRKLLILLAWVAGAAAAATTGTLTEQSQVRARKIVDSAVAAIGGAEALRSIEVVRLDLQGETFPRLQMTTPNPPYEPGRFHETLLLDLKRNRLLLEQQHVAVPASTGHLTVSIAGGEGTIYDNRATHGHAGSGGTGIAAAVHPVLPPAAAPDPAPGARSCRTRCATSVRTRSKAAATMSSPS